VCLDLGCGAEAGSDHEASTQARSHGHVNAFAKAASLRPCPSHHTHVLDNIHLKSVPQPLPCQGHSATPSYLSSPKSTPLSKPAPQCVWTHPKSHTPRPSPPPPHLPSSHLLRHTVWWHHHYGYLTHPPTPKALTQQPLPWPPSQSPPSPKP
jgi:hypothetical protein